MAVEICTSFSRTILNPNDTLILDMLSITVDSKPKRNINILHAYYQKTEFIENHPWINTDSKPKRNIEIKENKSKPKVL